MVWRSSCKERKWRKSERKCAGWRQIASPPQGMYAFFTNHNKRHKGKKIKEKKRLGSVFITFDPPLHGLGTHASVGAFLLTLSCHTYDWVMSHIWMSHVTHICRCIPTYIFLPSMCRQVSPVVVTFERIWILCSAFVRDQCGMPCVRQGHPRLGTPCLSSCCDEICDHYYE